MGRNLKKGLDYFSHDVDYDGKLEIVISKFGEKGHGIINRIWQHIYKTEGYYMDYNEDELFMIQRKCSDVKITEIEELITEMLKKSLFCKDKYNKYSILTSKRTQENYINVAERRTDVDINVEYFIFPLAKSTQSKLNKIIGKNTRGNNSDSKPELNDKKKKELMHISQLLEHEFQRLITADDIKYIELWVEEYDNPFDKVKDALLIAVKSNILKCSYINGILDNTKEGFVKLETPSLEETFKNNR